MGLIDANILRDDFDPEDSMEYDAVGVRYIIDSAPTIDPIRAAGGCWCGECKRYGPEPFGYGCHTIFDGKAAVIPHKPDHFCGDGKAREEKDDG